MRRPPYIHLKPLLLRCVIYEEYTLYLSLLLSFLCPSILLLHHVNYIFQGWLQVSMGSGRIITVGPLMPQLRHLTRVLCSNIVTSDVFIQVLAPPPFFFLCVFFSKFSKNYINMFSCYFCQRMTKICPTLKRWEAAVCCKVCILTLMWVLYLLGWPEEFFYFLPSHFNSHNSHSDFHFT